MGKDYYKILGVEKNASPEEIKKAYKKKALKRHPDRVSQDKKEEAQKKFQEIGEAFEVLSDPEKKKIYDQVGEDGLKGDIPEGASGFSGFGGMPRGGGTTFHFTSSNADDIFRNFFGTSDPFQAEGGSFGFPGMMGGRMGGLGGGGFGDMMGDNMSGGSRGQPHRSQKKADPIEHRLNVSLEELYNGTTKRMRITSKKVDGATGRVVPVTSDKEIIVKPGWKNGTKITFANEGDEMPGVIPADIVFIVQSKPHDRFVRDGDDLIYSCPVSLHDALCGVRTSVLSLDNRSINIEARHVTSDTVKIFPGEGMPNNKKRTKGDLRVKFQIVFPELSESDRTQIGSILRKYK